jgi:putative tricarboxylic transport membrane protein
VYSVHSSIFDLVLCVGIGVFAYFLRKMDFPMAPLILGFVLAELMEQNLRRALALSGGEVNILFDSGISVFLWICAALVLLVPLALHWLARRAKVAEPVELDLE